MGRLSSKLRSVSFSEGRTGVGYWCQGCEEMHAIVTQSPGRPRWEWDGNVDAPTFSPSVLCTYNGPDAGQVDEDGFRAPPAVCHTFIRAGQVEFLADCTHAFAGKTVPLPDLPERMQDSEKDGQE